MNSLGYSAAGSGTIDIGTAGVGTTAVTHGDGYNMVTVLTMAGVLADIPSGGASFATGLLIFTFPPGDFIVEVTHMDVGITQSEGFINADQPDVGLGTALASGANALLSTEGATSENIITGQTADNCTGTKEDITLVPTAGSPFIILAGDPHTLHFNAADAWHTGGDDAAVLSGDIHIKWTFLGA